jgi:hypothetical protein
MAPMRTSERLLTEKLTTTGELRHGYRKRIRTPTLL